MTTTELKKKFPKLYQELTEEIVDNLRQQSPNGNNPRLDGESPPVVPTPAPRTTEEQLADMAAALGESNRLLTEMMEKQQQDGNDVNITINTASNKRRDGRLTILTRAFKQLRNTRRGREI